MLQQQNHEENLGADSKHMLHRFFQNIYNYFVFRPSNESVCNIVGLSVYVLIFIIEIVVVKPKAMLILTVNPLREKRLYLWTSRLQMLRVSLQRCAPSWTSTQRTYTSTPEFLAANGLQNIMVYCDRAKHIRNAQNK